MPRVTLVVLLLLVVALAAAVSAPAPPPPAAGVRLAVVLVFDQLRGDYIDKWRPHFPEGGFRRLQDDGTWFTHCYYPYATTTTGPGHAAILSGATSDVTGIVNNEWYDRAAGANAYCAGGDRYRLVPAPAVPKGTADAKADVKTKPKPAGTPDRMLADTVADALKRHTGGKGKVFGLSLKDRSAILPTGKRPDGAYWFTGQFVTSTYYRDTLPAWVAEFNRSGFADQWQGRTWERSRPDLDYDRLAGPDDQPGEGTGVQSDDKAVRQGKTFPHPTPGGAKYADAVANSPFGNDLLAAFAKACVRAERLGADDVPDLLVVSFSSNDLVGHAWGPDSHEVLDVTLRTDRTVADLLRFLDAEVGAGRYSVTLTADHGICPLPEVSASRGKTAEEKAADRVPVKPLMAAAEEHLAKTFAGRGGSGKWIEATAFPWVYLSYKRISAAGVPEGVVAAVLANWLRGQDGVARVYTASDLYGHHPDDDDTRELARRSFRIGRCGDVLAILKPYHLPTEEYATGTTHGSPYPYDRHVPLIAFGPGFAGGPSDEPTAPEQAAAIVARSLGVPPPKDARFPLPKAVAKR